MNAKERIEAIAASLHTNVKALSELCGYERPQAFYDILKGKTRNISPTMADKVLGTFPQFSRIWLITGSGPMLEADREASQAKAAAEAEAEGATADAAHLVPLVTISAFAGPIKAFYAEGVALSNCPLVPSPVPQAEIAIPISGDSMEPEFPNGSTVFVVRINDQAFIPWGQPLVLDTENGVFIKTLRPDSEDKHYLWADSINPKYHPMHIPKASIFGLYRVLGCSKLYNAM